jgi:hypothetical protein
MLPFDCGNFHEFGSFFDCSLREGIPSAFACIFPLPPTLRGHGSVVLNILNNYQKENILYFIKNLTLGFYISISSLRLPPKDGVKAS